MMVSSTSTNVNPPESPASGGGGRSPSRAASASKNRAATASSWRTCPNVNARRNDPNVDGAYARAKTRPIPPC